MDYKEKYEKALSYMKDLVAHNVVSKGNAGKYFPELKESEDELMKREAISIVKQYSLICEREGDKCYTADRVIAWLEKQGEQKPTEKVEPKFKVGDWVVQDGIGTYKIIEICDSWYEVIDQEEKHFSIGFNKENTCNLWTIQDAKDGDVLAAHECYVIFKKIDGLNIKCYCTYHYLGFNPNFYADTLQNKNAFHPATKEQRDALMKAITDAGWKFDLEKKELKKIEQKSVDKVKPKFLPGECIRYRGENYKIKDIEENNDGFIYNVSIIGEPSDPEEVKTAIGFAAEQDMVKIEYLSWSEEDEQMIKDIIEAIDTQYAVSDYKEMVDWLKSLKDRVQPNKEWSAEDEFWLKEVVRCVRAEYPLKDSKIIAWLKSLKPHWKPSKEQMQVLEWCKPLWYEPKTKAVLESLITDLKKL